MRKTILLLLLLVCAGSLASVWGQGACTNNQVLACAGSWVSFISMSPPLRTQGQQCVGFQGQNYTGTWGGGYQDFKTQQSDLTLSWFSVQDLSQDLSGYDSCYLPCTSSIPVPSIGCPSPMPSVAPAKAYWINVQSGPDGTTMGAQPEFDSGGVNPTYDCRQFVVSIGTPVSGTVTVTKCFPNFVAFVIGVYQGAPQPDHCAFALQPAGPAPQCACGYQAKCQSGGQPGQGTWFCPAEFTQRVYMVTDTCGNEYIVTDSYDCGQFTGETKQPVSTDQCVPPGTPA